MHPLVQGFAIVILLCGQAIAGPLEDADVAIADEDFVAALRLLRPLAEGGDPKAQVKLGNLYANGRGVPESRVQAFRWMMMAANQGDAGAQYTLGGWYRWYSP